jgi:Holliday junction resolvase RusA-like endonuclease|tara:strand:+ start:922 stop:1359 length:438 start_codon:yes stop_codon:yes gene_type:complete
MRQSIIIEGQPVAAPRQTRSDRWRQRPAVMRYRAWCERARIIAAKNPHYIQCQNIAPSAKVRVHAFLAFPKSYSVRKRESLRGLPHVLKPDADNICKSILDALFKESDSAIHTIYIAKRWDDGDGARTIVEIEADDEIVEKNNKT